MRFKADLSNITRNTAQSCQKNFVELERVLQDLERRLLDGGAVSDKTVGSTAPADLGSQPLACWIINTNTATGSGKTLLTPCIVLNADLDIGEDTEVTIVF
jgi:hypothetical protein